MIDAVDYAAGDQPVESCYLRPIVNQKVRCDEDNVADVAGTRGDVAWQNVAPDMVEQVMVRGDVQLGSGFPTQLQIYNRLGVKTEDIVTIK